MEEKLRRFTLEDVDPYLLSEKAKRRIAMGYILQEIVDDERYRKIVNHDEPTIKKVMLSDFGIFRVVKVKPKKKMQRSDLASLGFTNNDRRLADVMNDNNIPERLWITVSTNGDVLIYNDCGNCWIEEVCDTVYYTPYRGK